MAQSAGNLNHDPVPVDANAAGAAAAPVAVPSPVLHGLVSVITAARNAADVIDRAVHSVAHQTIRVLEHIIVDDGSADRTPDVMADLQREYPHVHYVRQRWRGAAFARNCGIEAAQGRYIAFLDSDDLWEGRKLEHQIRFMEDSGALFTYGAYQVRDPVTERVIQVRVPPEQLTYRNLLGRCPIGCLTAVYNQERLGKVYMPLVQRGQDWGLWLALTRNGVTARRYPGNHAVYYARAGSLSSSKLLKSLDVYRIYRHQEGEGPARAASRLARFAWSRMWDWKV